MDSQDAERNPDRRWDIKEKKMSGKLEGKVAIITSGASGIGKAIATEFVKEGCAVAIAQRTIETLAKAKQELEAIGGKVLTVSADVSKEEDIIALAQKTHATFGKIDVLVNCTGVAGPIKNLVDMDLQEWNEALAVDLNGTMLCTREALKYMIPQNIGGSIINIGAEASRIADGWGGYPTRASYMACKAGVRAMQAAVSVEVGVYGIRVNTLSPAAVNSERAVKIMEAYAKAEGMTTEERTKIEKSKHSLKRWTEPYDIGRCAVFLASEDSISITNQTIACSSGMGLMAATVKASEK